MVGPPVNLKSSIPVAAVRLLQTLVPAMVVALSLYFMELQTAGSFGRLHMALAGVAAILTMLILQPLPSDSAAVSLDVGILVSHVFLRWMLVLVILYGLGQVSGLSEVFDTKTMVLWSLVSLTGLLISSALLQTTMRRVLISRRNQRSAVLVGANDVSMQLAQKLAEHPELCTRVAGFFDDRSAERLGAPTEVQLLGRLGDLYEYVQRERIDVIFIALPIRHIQRVMDLLDSLRDSTASIYFVPDVFVFDLIQSRTSEIMGVPVVAMCETPFYGYRGVMKRLTDLTFTMPILVVALPLMLFIAVFIRLTSPGPVIFRQRRYGLDGREIVVYKFRTMSVAEDGPTVSQATRDDARVTPLGRHLRRFSLDELPQLFNVLQGRMSLVGPRPHAVAHNELYRKLIKGYMVRHKVLPGITGLAQVSGCRGETPELEQMQARVDHDLEYLRRWSPSLDLKILVLTVVRLFRDSRAY